VVALQDAGLLVSRAQHAAHHRPPYDNNYCIVSGVWNNFLDKQRAFEALEKMLFIKLGVQPRSWSVCSKNREVLYFLIMCHHHMIEFEKCVACHA
jgi:hypothetical protein